MPRTANPTWMLPFVLISALAIPAGAQENAWLSQAASASAPASQPASAPAEETTVTWPPGLWMDALNALGAKDFLAASGLRFWGFVETGFTGRLTGGQHVLPGRVFDARRPNDLRLNQVRLTADRPYDSSKAFDIGGRIDGMFGGDALLTHSPGLFFNAGEGNGDAWADMVQAYGQLWFKTGSDSGLEATVGKFVTTHGLEVIDAVGNPLYSHSYLFGYAIPFTHTGVKLNYIWNSQISTYFAIVNGWEVFDDNNHAHSYMVGGAFSGKEKVGGNAVDSLAWNVITGPEQQADVTNNRTVVDATYTHRWTEKLSQSLNGDYGAEQNVPGIGDAQWYGLAHYLTYVFNDYASGTWRAEWFRDQGGSRTGVDAAWYENTWGVTIAPFPKDPILKFLTFRPEFRWDFANEPAFGDDHFNQLTAGVDMIYRF